MLINTFSHSVVVHFKMLLKGIICKKEPPFLRVPPAVLFKF